MVKISLPTKRLLSSIVLVLLVGGALLYDTAFTLLWLTLTLLLLLELRNAVTYKPRSTTQLGVYVVCGLLILGIAILTLLLFSLFHFQSSAYLKGGLAIFTGVLVLIFILLPALFARARAAILCTVGLGYLLLIVACCAGLYLWSDFAQTTIHQRFLFFLFFLPSIWITDTMAYFIGRAVKGPRFAPRISPNKTWSGTVGGLLCGILWGLVVLYTQGKLVQETVFFACTIPLIAILGDLLISRGKRILNLKDSGTMIPGHGGVWDRLDSLIGVLLWFALVYALRPLFLQNFLAQWL